MSRFQLICPEQGIYPWRKSYKDDTAAPATFIGGDSSPASIHGSLLKQTHNESVSTDLHVLSRGFIPGGIVVMSGIETRLT